ncbi:MAG TPA: hypothetical protein PK264_06970 [Hyphomicrobiaceae bacterium]|nr:hypothetical protein [Hyphomicrobiaceae bacterium]
MDRSVSFERVPLLRGIDIDHGPREQIGQLLLTATDAAAARGLKLYLTTLADILAINEANQDSWGPLAPMYNPRLWGPDDGEAMGIVGLNADGVAVATQAVRLFELTETSFADEAKTMRLFYRDPEAQSRPGESCTVTAPSAGSIKGRVAMSGGVWYRPDYRGKQLANILPRIGRACSLAQWDIDYSVAINSEAVFKGGMAGRAGFPHSEWELLLHFAPIGDIRFAINWITKPELIDDFSTFVAGFDVEGKRAVENRRA